MLKTKKLYIKNSGEEQNRKLHIKIIKIAKNRETALQNKTSGVKKIQVKKIVRAKN